MGNITPTVELFPREFQGGRAAVLMMTVTNTNPNTQGRLRSGDWFDFAFDPPWGQSVQLLSPSLILNSQSGALVASDWVLAPGANGRSVRVTFVAPAGGLPVGEGFGFAVRFMAPPGFAFGQVVATSRASAARLDPIAPARTTVAFTAAPDGSAVGDAVVNVNRGVVNVSDSHTRISGGETTVVDGRTTVNGGSTTINAGQTTVTGGTTTVAGGETTVTGGNVSVNNGTIDTGAGTVVNVGPGTIVNITGSTPAGPSRPSGPNFLQVAAAKWHEAAGLTPLTLSERPEALAFDGRSIWAILASHDMLAQIDCAARTVTEVGLTGVPVGVSSQPGGALNTMVYDGQKFWISGTTGGFVVGPDGVVVANSVPACVAGAMVFDGTSVWVGSQGALHRFDASAPDQSLTLGTSDDIVGLTFDGRHVWIIARRSLGTGALLHVEPSGLTAAIPVQLPFDPAAIAYDGRDLWIADASSNAVRRWTYDRENETTIPISSHAVGFGPTAVLFDGAHIWVANRGSHNVTKLRADDGSSVGTFDAPPFPRSMAFDGIHVWVASGSSAKLGVL